MRQEIALMTLLDIYALQLVGFIEWPLSMYVH
jgi:hypothetical protein